MAGLGARVPRSVRTLLELSGVVAVFGALSVWFTHPLALNLGKLGYKLEAAGDAQYSVWNIAWVAHALIEYPGRVFNANIFHPHRGALFFSEPNLLGGALAVPVYWATRDAYTAHNVVLLLSFVLSATATYYLVKYLIGDRRAAGLAAVSFAFCPYVFSHLPHIQLLMTWGIPLSLLAYHRLVDRPSLGRGVALGLAVAGQALACAYYGVFVVLLIGVALVVTAGFDRAWPSRQFVKGFLAAVAVGAVIVGPLFLPYTSMQRESGFRQIAEAALYSATWSSYLASGGHAWNWLLPRLPQWGEVLFPGVVLVCSGLAGVVMGWIAGGTRRRLVVLYAVLGTVAFWESFGPQAGLYTLTARVLPAFEFVRAPSRIGVVVTLALAVLGAIAIARLPVRRTWAILALVSIAVGSVAERVVPMPLTPVPPLPRVYDILAEKPYGPVLELPVYSRPVNFRRTRYMLGSTVHWKPLVNAYSDFIPGQFSASRQLLADFPSAESFGILEEYGVRYAVFHLGEYNEASGHRARLTSKLEEFAPFLREVYSDSETWLFEITGYPPTTW